MAKVRVVVLLIALMMTLSLVPAASYASGAGPEEWTEEGEWHDFEEESEESDGLTPDGNLTLVDDYGDAPDSGQQFITLVTKNGNYFYLVIDRDKDGNENAHFMNLVDESVLFELLEDDAKDAAEAEADRIIQEAEAQRQAEAAAAAAEKQEVPKNEKKRVNLAPLFAVVFLILAGGGGWFLMQTKKKKKAEDAPDPDADYSDYEEDYEVEPEIDDEDDEPEVQEDVDDGNVDDQ